MDIKELTWKDIATIITIYEEGIEKGNISKYGDTSNLQKYSEYVLSNFLEIKDNMERAKNRKFKIGDIVQKKNPKEFDYKMKVVKIGDTYYYCNNIGKFSGWVLAFENEDDYEIVQ